MKKVFVMALLVVGITAFAQEKDSQRAMKERMTPEQKVDIQVKKMTKDLNLNDKQSEQVKALVTKEVQKREEKRKQMDAAKEKNRAEMRSQMEADQAAASAEFQKILTPEQYAKWQKARDERKEKMKEKMEERKEKRDSKQSIEKK